MRRAAGVLLAAALAVAGEAPGSGLEDATTLAALSRGASSILLASPVAFLPGGRAVVFVEESWRGAPAGATLVIAGVPAPSSSPLLLLYLAEAPGGPLALGGERGAVPIDPFSDAALLGHARGLVPLADSADERLLAHLAAGLSAPAARVREDSAADLLRLPAGLLRRLDGEFLAAAIEAEDGPTAMRGALLRLLGARGSPGDAPAVVREAIGGPIEHAPLVGRAARDVPGATEALARALREATASTRLRIVRALGAAGDLPSTRALEAAAFGDSSPLVRQAALAALARPGPAVDGAAMVHVVATGPAPERRLAARAILLRGSPEDLEVLRALGASIPEVGEVLGRSARDSFPGPPAGHWR